jgi:HAD superfamily hydrolase (TIGR01509 family)
LKEGALDLLKYLKRNHMKAGIATSNSRELVDLVIAKLGIKDYFQTIRTSCEVERGKPSPDIYLLVSKDLGVSAEHCLVFEDVPAGVLAGKNAGMRVCGVFDPFSEADKELIMEQADYYIHSFHELLD